MIRRTLVLSGSDFTANLDQIDASISQGIDKTPQTGIVKLARPQYCASWLYRVDLGEVSSRSRWTVPSMRIR